MADVGTPKVKCIERTLKQISRWVDIDARLDIWRKEEGGNLLEGADWVIGKTFGCQSQTIADSAKMPSTISPLRSTYSSTATKTTSRYDMPSIFSGLQTYAILQVFSSMGAGAKCDPTRIQISDISYTIYDPLARSVRRRLRLHGISSGIPVVYSTEVPGDVKLLPLPEEEYQKGDVNELGVFDDFRVRILPVLGWYN